jgi:hypothetical protein
MRKNPERVAWTVLATAFVVFCVLAAGIPLAVRSYVLNASDDQDTQLQVIEGTVLVQEARKSDLTAVTESTTLRPGDEVLTDDTSWATLDLFERSHLTLYGNTKVKLEEITAPRFGLSNRLDQIKLDVTGGLVRVGVALPAERDKRFEVLTPHTAINLAEGSYRIEVTNKGTQVTVVRGQAVVKGNGTGLMVPHGTRTMVDLSGQAIDPLPAARNLIENGDFRQPEASGWLTSTVVLTTSVEPPAVQFVENGGRRSVRLVRRESDDGIHSEVAISQELDQDVRDFVQLELSLDLMLEFQSLSGGGLLSSEFPIIVRLDYKDLWGNDKFWTHGFYYQNRDGYPIAPDPWGRPSGDRIPRGVWYPYGSGNLLDLLGENKPAHITGLTIYASGWNYDSQISEVQLIAE